MRVPLVVGVVSLIFVASSARAGEITGPFANRLSPEDVKQIKAAVSKERSVSHNVKKIEALKSDKVAVQTTARTAVNEDTTYDFTVYKRAGVWAIDPNSIQISTEYRDFRTNGPSIIR